MKDYHAPAEDEPKYPDVDVQLTGTSGNTGAMMGLVSAALKERGVSPAEITEFRLACLSGTYEDAIRTMTQWVNVS